MTNVGIQHITAGGRLTRHRHAEAYAALVLAGTYVEAGDRGRLRVRAGDVVFHAPHEAHLNAFTSGEVAILNLPMRGPSAFTTATLDDVDAIVRLAERDPREAADALRATCRPSCVLLDDWPDHLAALLATDTTMRIDEWAERSGLAPQSVSRGFQRVYGVSPKRYRLEQRALSALRRLDDWRGTYADLAAETGFADQAHLCRAVVAMTGRSLGRLKVQSVQDRA